MKKNNLLLLGVAMMVLASCTNEKVGDVASDRAISFNTFMDNNPRATNDLTNSSITNFFVFGDYDNGASIAFNNTEVIGGKVGDNSNWIPKQQAWWQLGKNYTFGAYSNSNEQLSNISYENGTLTISGYSVSNRDLIASVVKDITAPGAGEDKSVALTFKHLLSKIKFTFSTDAVPDAYIMEVSDLQIANAMKENVSVTVNELGITTPWAGETNGTYSIEPIEDYAVEEGKTSSEECYVIPQNNVSLTATFKVTLKDEKTKKEISSGTFKALLKTENGKWEEGYAYNYTAKINPDEVDPEQNLRPIQFTVTTVTDWEWDNDVATTPEKTE